ncbi:MAG: phosphoribosylaminoimidazolesuccinocarboxamide synthase [Parvibaculales bacterium]
MPSRKKIYEGKAKTLFEGPEAGLLIQFFKDDATAFNAEKHDIISGKGVLNQRISEYIFTQLEQRGIPTHFVKTLNEREQLIKEVEIIPIEVVLRNIAAGSISKRLGLPEGNPLPRTIVEFYYKDDNLGDPMIAPDHITAFGWASEAELQHVTELGLRINDFLTELFLGCNIKLVDFKLEFGRRRTDTGQEIILADEISPDNCRLWDRETDEKLDKDRFRRDLGGMVDAYQEVARRLGLIHGTQDV